MNKTLKERFLSKVRIDENSGCWMWTASCQKAGYGQIMTGDTASGFKPKTAHVVAYELFVGAIPEGYDIDHLCRIRPCCNPKHLEAVTHRVNCLRGHAPSILASKMNHCVRGHEYTQENTEVTKNGGRRCKKCHKERQVEFRMKNPFYKRERWARNLEENRAKQRDYLARKKQRIVDFIIHN